MSMVYVADFLDVQLEKTLAETRDPAKISQCFKEICGEIIIGPDTDYWVLAAILNYLEKNGCLSDKGSKLGQSLYKINDYLQLLIPIREVESILGARSRFDPRKNTEDLAKQLAQSLHEWKKHGYAEEFSPENMAAYVDTFSSFLDTLKDAKSRGQGLIVIAPY